MPRRPTPVAGRARPSSSVAWLGRRRVGWPRMHSALGPGGRLMAALVVLAVFIAAATALLFLRDVAALDAALAASAWRTAAVGAVSMAFAAVALALLLRA